MKVATSDRAVSDRTSSARWYEDHRTRDASPWMFSAVEERAAQKPLWSTSVLGMTFSAVNGGDSVWVIVGFASGARMALRAAYCPRGELSVVEADGTDSGARLRIESAIGTFRTEIRFADEEHPLLHVTT